MNKTQVYIEVPKDEEIEIVPIGEILWEDGFCGCIYPSFNTLQKHTINDNDYQVTIHEFKLQEFDSFDIFVSCETKERNCVYGGYFVGTLLKDNYFNMEHTVLILKHGKESIINKDNNELEEIGNNDVHTLAIKKNASIETIKQIYNNRTIDNINQLNKMLIETYFHNERQNIMSYIFDNDNKFQLKDFIKELLDIVYNEYSYQLGHNIIDDILNDEELKVYFNNLFELLKRYKNKKYYMRFDDFRIKTFSNEKTYNDFVAYAKKNDNIIVDEIAINGKIIDEGMDIL